VCSKRWRLGDCEAWIDLKMGKVQRFIHEHCARVHSTLSYEFAKRWRIGNLLLNRLGLISIGSSGLSMNNLLYCTLQHNVAWDNAALWLTPKLVQRILLYEFTKRWRVVNSLWMNSETKWQGTVLIQIPIPALIQIDVLHKNPTLWIQSCGISANLTKEYSSYIYYLLIDK
jgi:hypothetical protein